jgi:iron complex outermembrane receptor protein
VSVTFNEFHLDDDPVYGDNRLPAAPTYVARGEVLYRHDNGIFAGPTFDLVGDRYVDFTNSYTVEGYELMGVRVGFTGQRFEVFGEVRNVFDEDYIATISVLNDADADSRVLNPGAPASAYAGIRFSFR